MNEHGKKNRVKEYKNVRDREFLLQCLIIVGDIQVIERRKIFALLETSGDYLI
jgi:hypothetical protein